jgi:lipoyl(octanoyl) transferase
VLTGFGRIEVVWSDTIPALKFTIFILSHFVSVVSMTVGSTVSAFANRLSNSLEVHLMGLLDFDSALFLQERLHYEIAGREDTLGGLLICEHPPLITVGREGSRADIRPDPNELEARQLKVRWVGRGGPAVMHSPGQLAVYPVLPLDRLNIGLSAFRRLLEETVIDVCNDGKIKAWRDSGQSGVWCRTGRIATIGAAVKRWVSHQGMFVNVAPDPELADLVQYPGQDPRVSSFATESRRRISMHSIRSGLIHHLAGRFGYADYHLYTGHPLLTRTKKRVYDYAAHH